MTGYYMIGYYTTNTATDGRYRRVKVALAGNLSADVSYREGYYGDKVFAKFTTRRQGAPARRRAAARQPHHRYPDGRRR